MTINADAKMYLYKIYFNDLNLSTETGFQCKHKYEGSSGGGGALNYDII